jgi:branched-chain amino acid transport system permease protein
MDGLTNVLQYLLSGLAVGSVYAIVAVGFTIIFSATEVVNFAQGEFVMLGAMISYWLSAPADAAMPIPGLGWPLYLAVPLAVVIAMAVGLLLGWVLMRPLKETSSASLIIITVGASIFLVGIAGQLWGKESVNNANFTSGSPMMVTLPDASYAVVLMPQQLWVMGLAVALVVGLSLFFNRTLVGKAMRAVAVNRHGARLMGVNVARMVMGAFALSAGLGAVAGAAVAPISTGSFDMGAVMGLKGFAAAIAGGLGNFTGSIIAGLLLGVLEGLGAGYISSQYKDAFAFIILLVVLIVSPGGILTMWRRRRRA